MNTRRIIDFIRKAAAIAVLLTAGISPVRAATLVVTTTVDSGAGSLREAISSANLSANVPDVIIFNISGTGPHTLSPLTPLPVVTDPVVIDGYSQSGSSSNTLANGNDAVLKLLVLGDLVIDTTNSTVRGLAIRHVQFGATPGPKGRNLVEGCFVGLDTTGTNSLISAQSGVFVQTPNNRVGGTNAGARNVISGKDAAGIEVFQNFATNNVIQGNFVGTDRTGTQAIGNNDRAVVVNLNASRTTIGGTTPGARNVISGNLNRGITLDGSNNVVQGNFIGTDVLGLPLGNARTGVEIGGGGNLVGGTNSGAGNVIAFNGVNGGGATTNGIDVKPGAANYSILGNCIFDNAGLGIDVNADTLITAGYPVITLASNTLVSTVIRGSNTPSTAFRLELFVNPTVDPSGFGEGKTILISTNVTTDAGGTFTVNLSSPIVPGLFITATANGTSEFSQARMVIAAGRTNSWISGTGGKWETAGNWSLNVAPYTGQTLVLITNANTKTVLNDATTAGSFPSTLTISNLVIGAPAGATNTLALNHGGTNTPLRILSSLTVNSGGAMNISNAAVLVGRAPVNPTPSILNGRLTLNDGEFTVTNGQQFYIGNGGSGALAVSNGLFQATYPIVGIGAGGNGVWDIAGGVCNVSQTFDLGDSLTATGAVRMTGGELYTPVLYVGLFGNGSMIISNNAYFECDGNVSVSSQPGSVGRFTAAGEAGVYCRSMEVGSGFQSTGTLLVADNAQMTVGEILEGNSGGTVRIDGGTLVAINLWLNGTNQFQFNQGYLLTGNVLASNNTPFVVGDGTNSAVYQTFYDTNLFPRGLRISPHATLSGGGNITGFVTNFGTINPGYYGTLGEIHITGGLVLPSSSDLHFDISSYDYQDFLRTTGNVVLGGKLSVDVIDEFWTFITNGASFTLLTNTTVLTGAFTNVASGGLLTSSNGYVRFTVLYAGSRTIRLTNAVIVDTDGDTLPDWWEDDEGLDKNNPADAAQDLDGDGASNLAEYLAGTNPDFDQSVLRIVAINREGNNLRITWNTVEDRSYRLQTNAPAANGGITTNFADFGPTISSSSESTTNFLHIGAATNATRYYRIRLVPPGSGPL